MRRWPFVLLFPFASWAWNIFQHISGLIQLCYYCGYLCYCLWQKKFQRFIK